MTNGKQIVVLDRGFVYVAAASYRLDGALPALVTALGLAAVVRIVPVLVARGRR